MFIPPATSRAPQSLWDCSVRWLLLQVVTEAPVRQTITHCNGVTSWTALLLAALRKRSCITCPRDLNAHRKQASQKQAVTPTSFYSTQSISIAAIGLFSPFEFNGEGWVNICGNTWVQFQTVFFLPRSEKVFLHVSFSLVLFSRDWLCLYWGYVCVI